MLNYTRYLAGDPAYVESLPAWEDPYRRKGMAASDHPEDRLGPALDRLERMIRGGALDHPEDRLEKSLRALDVDVHAWFADERWREEKQRRAERAALAADEELAVAEALTLDDVTEGY